MPSEIHITHDEISLVEKHLKKMGEKAKHWKKNRWLCLVLGLIILAVFSVDAYSIFQNFQKQYYTPHSFTQDDIPEDITTDEWFVFKLNRFAMFFEVLHQLRCLDLIESLICIIMIACGFLLTILVLMRWKNGPRDLAMTKVLQANFNLWIERNDSQASAIDLSERD
jgi:competence protein ComGC